MILRALPSLLLLCAGCVCPDGLKIVGPPPRDAQEALQRVNDNIERLRGVLYGPSVVSFKYRDESGERHSVPPSDATLYYRSPQCLLFDVHSLGGDIAQFGSNDDRYWLWVEDELWWGTWELLNDRDTRRLPVPPDELFDALMLRPIPGYAEGGLAAMLRIDGADYRLLFVRLDRYGDVTGWREIRLQPAPPYMPSEITDRLSDGTVLLHATLDDYQAVGTGGPFTPRRYVVQWPQREAELRLDVRRAEFREDLEDVDFCEFPESWNGRIERIDAPGGDGVSRAGDSPVRNS